MSYVSRIKSYLLRHKQNRTAVKEVKLMAGTAKRQDVTEYLTIRIPFYRVDDDDSQQGAYKIPTSTGR